MKIKHHTRPWSRLSNATKQLLLDNLTLDSKRDGTNVRINGSCMCNELNHCSNGNKYIAFLVKKDNEYIAWAVFYDYDKYVPSAMFYVMPKYRRQGIGTELIARIKRYMKRHTDRISFDVFPWDRRSEGFFNNYINDEMVELI